MLDSIPKLYFDWLCCKVTDNGYITYRKRYSKLLRFLHNYSFYYILAMDKNRWFDGIGLRHSFAKELYFDNEEVDDALQNKDCSVLEMMVALAMRIESAIMIDAEIGDQNGRWFWLMINNLKLNRMDNRGFHEGMTEDILSRFLDRKYEYDGDGGLFRVVNPRFDMRFTEIWYQAMWYLTENTEGEHYGY